MRNILKWVDKLSFSLIIISVVVFCDDNIHQIISKSRPDQLPSCANITLLPGQYSYSQDTSGLVVTVGFEPQTIDNFNTSVSLSRNLMADMRYDNLTVCYPLSPQLLNCPVIKVQDYRIESNLTLLTSDGLVVNLGDYYVDPQGIATICSEPIIPIRGVSRCNYLTVHAEEIRLLDDGSWMLNRTGDVMFRPEVLATPLDRNSFNVCWPLAVSFISCPVVWMLDQHEYKIRSDHSLYFTTVKLAFAVGEYFRSGDYAIVCRIEEKPNFHRQIYIVYTGFYILSTVCLVFTVIYQLMAPKLTYHTRCLLCHVISMCVMYIGLTLRKYITVIPPSFCYALYVVTYMSALSAFFWLNVLAFDVWQFFCSMQTARFRLPIRVCVSNRFTCYSIYAWSMPAILCVLSVVLDQNRDLQKQLGLFPEISSMCWFNERPSLWAFYYGPLAILMCLNSIFFVFTVLNLRFASVGTEIINRKRNKQLFIVCLKLFVVMGLCWLAEIFTWVVTSDENFNYYWYISNIFTSLQGVAIFLVYTAKKENFNILRNKICPNTSQKSFSAFPEFTKTKLSVSDSGQSDVTSVSTMSVPDSIEKEKSVKNLRKIRGELTRNHSSDVIAAPTVHLN